MRKIELIREEIYFLFIVDSKLREEYNIREDMRQDKIKAILDAVVERVDKAIKNTNDLRQKINEEIYAW